MKRAWIGGLIALLLLTTQVFAANRQYTLLGTAITFKDTGGTYGIDFANTGTGTGKFSDRADKNSMADATTGAMPEYFWWTCTFQLTSTNVVNEKIEIYTAWSDGTNVDGGLATTKNTLATDKRRNLKLIGMLTVDQTTTNTSMTVTGFTRIPTRYFNLAIWNATTLTMRNDTSVHSCTFQPAVPQSQNN